MKKTTKKTTLDDVMDVISEWEKDKEVCFVGSFFSDDPAEDRMIAYGEKESVELMLSELLKAVKEDKEEFINW